MTQYNKIEGYSLADFDYEIPRHLVAQEPADPRDTSRLMVIDRDSSKGFIHDRFYNIGNYLMEGDVVVINNSKVIPARLTLDSGQVIVLIRAVGTPTGYEKNHAHWLCLIEQGSLETVTNFTVEGKLDGYVVSTETEEVGTKGEKLALIGFRNPAVLSEVGQTPIPPYIKDFKGDSRKYQTVYAKVDGSSAAPTAGLHFTENVFQSLREKGINIAEVTLHVSLDTFMPVTSDDPRNHKIYTEYIEVSKEAADIINQSKRVIATGTTCVRTLEQTYARLGYIGEYSGWADLFIYPGYEFKVVSGLITNFHYPRSSNLMLVSAFAGVDTIKKSYKVAIVENYRFYSFGDATLII